MNDVVRRIRAFFIPGEKEAFERISQLASLGENALELLVKMLSASTSDLALVDVDTARISSLEKEGDKITQSIEEEIGKGSISASLSNDFGRLVDCVDSVLDRAHAVSRQLRRMAKGPVRESGEFDASFRMEQVRLV